MKIQVLVLLMSFAGGTVASYAHENCAHKYDSLTHLEVYFEPKTMPSFPGGKEVMMAYLIKNFTPPDTINKQGKFVFEFIIDVDGRLIGPRVYGKESTEVTPWEKEWLKTLGAMPAWKPGKCGRKKVPVRMLLPITL